MRLRWILFTAASVAAGFGFGRILPKDWGFTAPYGLLLGSAIYFFGFHALLTDDRDGRRERVRGNGAAGMLVGGILRAGLLLACNTALLYVSYGMDERVDLTWPLATLASWSLMERWMDRTRRTGPDA